MNAQSLDDAEREEIEMLLPWYVTGRLGPADLAKVDAYLAAHPHVARQLDLARAERDETVAANEALGLADPGATERLMASLPAARPGWAALGAVRGGLKQLGDLFVAPTAHAVRWAAVAAAVLLAVQAVAIVTLLNERGGTYQTASGAPAGNGIAVLVTFADEAKATAISQLLADFDASIVDGPKAGGVYKVRLRTEDRSQAAREALVRRLAERRDVVRAVLPSRD
jgi:flagellar basal body-associated protein FliL